MLIGAESEAATGALGFDQASLVAKALNAPNAKAARAAMIIDRTRLGLFGGCCEFNTADISFIFRRLTNRRCFRQHVNEH